MDWRLLRFAGIDLLGQFGGAFLGGDELVGGEFSLCCPQLFLEARTAIRRGD